MTVPPISGQLATMIVVCLLMHYKIRDFIYNFVFCGCERSREPDMGGPPHLFMTYINNYDNEYVMSKMQDLIRLNIIRHLVMIVIG